MNKEILKKIMKPLNNDKIIIDFKDKLYVGTGITSKPTQIFTAEMMDSVIVEKNIGNVYEYLGETNEKYVKGALYFIEEE